MHNIFLIARREYLERIRTKSFIIATILIPLLMGGGIAASILLARNSKSNAHLAVISTDEALATDLQNELEHGKDSEMIVDVISPPGANTRAELNGELKRKSLDGYLWINPPRGDGDRPQVIYRQGSSADISTRSNVRSVLSRVLTRERLVKQGMSATEVDAMLTPVDMQADESGGTDNTALNFASAYVLFFLMYMVIMLYGMNVARSIIEEKTSRVFEVMLATVRPGEMMAGKVIGVGSVGLTQVSIWMLAAALLTGTSLVGHFMGGNTHITVSPVQIAAFLVYFLLGYLLYSSIAAALGAMTNSEQELQQLNLFLVMPLAICMFSLAAVITAPDGKLATTLSLIPFCTPLLMYMRIALGHVHPAQIALSLVLMVATIYAVLWVAARIYRVGILMYGKRPTLPEIVRWLKYS